MKANEFMVGDLVYSTFCDKPCKVVGIEQYESEYAVVKVTNVSGAKDIHSLTPIPLTPEILEKNGFIRGMFYGEWEFDLDPFPFFVVQRKDNSWYLGREEYGILKYREIIDISYVHELQHALRLCGINHEIIL